MTGKRSSIQPPAGTTIFAAMTQLATQTGAINLGQGFPDTDGPDSVLETAIQAVRDGANQYPPGTGTPGLKSAIATHQKTWYNLDLDPATEVLVTTGATEAIAASILALVSPGDEVVVFEPYYDSYAAMIRMAGGKHRSVPLKFPDFALDVDALEASMSERTAVIMLNTPHNPTGKVFTRDELKVIAKLAERYDAIVLSDEVYEHLAYAPFEHIPAATIPELASRTITFGSGGKTFNTTGWKIGWLTGPADLVAVVAGVKQFLTYASGTPLQMGIAEGLRLPAATFERLRESMAARRDLLVDGLSRAGFTTVTPQGGYFVLADAAGLGVRDTSKFALELPKTAGVVAIPVGVFCDDPADTQMSTVMRFAFCKKEEVLHQAIERLVATFGQ